MIGVIADDLSGAAELGAVGLRHGLRAEIVMAGPPGGRVDLVCYDTDSRSAIPREARRRARAAAKLFAAADARWIFKKVDSVLRGQVLAELAAVMEEWQVKLALVVPSNPVLGRVIRDGKYFIGGKPIHETQFARDPEHPRTSAQVHDLLGASAAHAIQIRKPGEDLPSSGIVIGEAQTPADLRAWAARADAGMLVAGAAEFFATLLAARKKARFSAPPRIAAIPAIANELFVCGSASESAREFMRAAKKSGTPFFSLPAELAAGAKFSAAKADGLARQAIAAFQKHFRVVLGIALPLVGEQAVARRLAAHLVAVAGKVIRSGSVGHVYAEGGATAAELARHMGWERLRVLREIAPGVATVAVAGGSSLLFTLKPGTYAWPDEVRQISTSPCPPIRN